MNAERIHLWQQALPSLVAMAVIVVLLLAAVIIGAAASREIDDAGERALATPVECPACQFPDMSKCGCFTGSRTISLFEDDHDACGEDCDGCQCDDCALDPADKRPEPCPLSKCKDGATCGGPGRPEPCGGCCDCQGVCRYVYEWDEAWGGPLALTENPAFARDADQALAIGNELTPAARDAFVRATERKATPEEIERAYRRYGL